MTKTLLSLMLCFGAACSFTAHGQSWQWARGARGGITEGWPVATDRDGDVFIAGYNNDTSVTFGSITVPNGYHVTQMVIAKYSPTGNVLWAKGSTNGTATVFSIATDPTGDLYVFGGFDTSFYLDTFALRNPGTGNPYFLAKLDPAGNVLWAKAGPGMEFMLTQYPNAIATDPQGNPYITCTFSSASIVMDTITLSLGAGMHVVVAKYDTMGHVVWAKAAAGYGCNLAVTDSGYTYLGHGNTTEDTTFLVKYDATGNVLWTQNFTDAGAINLNGIAADSAGDAYITGSFTGGTLACGSYALTNATQSSGYLAKYSPAGSVMWAKAIKTTGTNRLSAIQGFSAAIDACGNAWVCGIFGAGDTLVLDTHSLVHPALSFDPVFIVGYSPSGAVVDYTALQSGGDDFSGIATDRFGNLFVSNDYGSTMLIAGTDTLPTATSECMYVAKYNPNLGCGETIEVLLQNNVNPVVATAAIYPNPVADECTVALTCVAQANTSMAVYDVTGRLVHTYPLTGSTTTISTANLPQGMYQCRIDAGSNGVVCKKLVVIR